MQNSSDNFSNHDTAMSDHSSAVETRRLARLRDMEILDSLPEEAYEDIALLASHICRTPIALVSLLDEKRQWFKAKVGMEASETPRSWSFCEHAIQKPGELMVVSDARNDSRFADNPLVNAAPHIRFYAGAPLVTEDGTALGTLCVIDVLPRELDPDQQAALRALARQVMARMELRQTLRENKQYFDSFLRPLISTGAEGSTPFAAAESANREAIRQAGEWQQAILDSANLTIISTDTQGVIQTCNAGALRNLGYEAAEIIGKTPDIFHIPAEIEQRTRELSKELKRPLEPGLDTFTAKARTGVPDENDWTYVRKDGTSFLVRLTVTPLRDKDGQINGFLGVGKDITQQKIAEVALKESEARFQAFMDNGPAVTFIKDEAGFYIYVNKLFLSHFNFRREEIIGHSDEELWPEEIHRMLRQHDLEVLAGDELVSLEENTPAKDGGTTFWLSFKFPLQNRDGRKLLAGIAIDITERKEYERRLEELAVTDSLTGLKNHGAFAQRLAEEFERASRYHLDLSLIMLDVDYFKTYNDSFGHLEGDEVLRRMGKLLREHARPGDFPSRYGGEEFAVILTNTCAEGALAVASRIREDVESQNLEKGRVTVSLGVATMKHETPDINALIKAADAALYEAKAAGRNCIREA